ncbi:MAG: MATE family efflux transporter, partial [Calditrichia bacterium]|nr:MATE family efflux transporter [Calditrichia bacterium]
MNYSKELNETVKLAYPVIIGQLGHMMMGVVDSVMVGEIGAAPLAASSIAHGLFMLFMIFGIGVSMAISPLTAMVIGAKKYSECGIVFRQGLLVNIIIGIVLTIAIIFSADIIRFLNQPEEIIEQGAAYMRILAYSVIPVMIFQTYKQFSEGLSIMRPAMVITLLANIINVFANWVLIYGNLGMPAMHLPGAGWATFSTRALMAVSFLLYVSLSIRYKPYDPTLHYRRINFSMIKKILRIGIPGGLQYFFEVGAFVGSAIIIGWMGTNELAAHQIAINLASLSFMVALGISAAATIRVGNAVGRDDRKGARNAGIAAFILSAAVMGIFGIIFIVFRWLLPTLYIDEPEVINIAASLLIIAALFQLSDGTQAVGIGLLRGLADAKIPMFITFIAYWIVGLPGGYLLGFTFG